MATAAKKRSSPPPTPPLKDIKRSTPSPDKVERPPRPSSPDTCPICLDTFCDKTDRAYSDNCFHIFCFECLLEWSNNKRECPLCKKPFKAIMHKIKSHSEYEVHKLPPPPVPDSSTGRHMAWTNVTWEWMSQMRQQFIQNRRQQLERIRNGTQRHSTLGARNVTRPATTDRRRFVYRYELYSEGAELPGGSASRYRRTTPDFYRRNPAQIHRLVPWLNRELVAILPHRDNVQFVLDHILAEIRRIDMRSQDFMLSIRPFLLNCTDHFMHEFHQFAMSPLDMAGWDTYVRYPPTPRGAIPLTLGEERRSTTSRANLAAPSRDSSSSDEEVPSITLRSLPRPTVPASQLTLPSTSTYHNVAPPSNSMLGGGRRRMSWHRQRLIAEELGTADIRPVPLMQQSRRRNRQWESNTASSSSISTPGSSRSHADDPVLTASQRAAQRRLRRSLNRINVLSHPSSLTLTRGPITTVDLEAEPSPTDVEPRAVPGYERIVDRVRDFLNSIEDEPTPSGSQSGLSMPTFGELTGDMSPDIDVTGLETPPLPGMDLLQPSTSSGSRSSSQRFMFNPDTDDSESSAPASPALPYSAVTPRDTRAASPASSHSSDVILVGEEKPWRERTPIELSSESEGEGKMPKAFLTEAGIKRSADRRLSMSSVDYEEGPSTSTKTTKKRQKKKSKKSSPERRTYTPSGPPDLSEISSDEEEETTKREARTPPTSSSPAAAAVGTWSYDERGEESSDSDCMVTFQAAKPKLLGHMLENARRAKEKKSKHRKHSKEHKKHKKSKHSEKESRKKHKRKSSPHKIQENRIHSPSIDVEGDSSSAQSHRHSPKKRKKSKRSHHRSASPEDERRESSTRHTMSMDVEFDPLTDTERTQNDDSHTHPLSIDNQLASTDMEIGDQTSSAADELTAVDDEKLSSQSGTSCDVLTNDELQDSEEQNSSQGPADIREQIRHFAKEKIASKYSQKNCKKHDRGHKKSHKQDKVLLSN